MHMQPWQQGRPLVGQWQRQALAPCAPRSLQDGKVLQNFAGCGLQNILRVLRAEPDQLTCLNDQGVVVGLKPASRPAQRVQLAVAEGEDEDEDGDEVAGAPGEEEQAAIDAAGLADAALEQEQPTGSGGPAPGAEAATLSPAPVAASGVGPEFLAETGYRGVRWAALPACTSPQHSKCLRMLFTCLPGWPARIPPHPQPASHRGLEPN